VNTRDVRRKPGEYAREMIVVTLLLEEIYRQMEQEGEDGALPIVSFDLFFEGNNDEGSIGCNLLNHPGIEVFYNTLKKLKSLNEVQDIFVEIYEVEDVEWPFSERIYVLSSLNSEEIFEYLSTLEPSEISDDYQFGKPTNAPELNKDMKVYSIWWD